MKGCACGEAPYTPYEGPSLANQKSRKLGVFGRKFEGSHTPFECYFNEYKRKWKNNVQSMSYSFI